MDNTNTMKLPTLTPAQADTLGGIRDRVAQLGKGFIAGHTLDGSFDRRVVPTLIRKGAIVRVDNRPDVHNESRFARWTVAAGVDAVTTKHTADPDDVSNLAGVIKGYGVDGATAVTLAGKILTRVECVGALKGALVAAGVHKPGRTMLTIWRAGKAIRGGAGQSVYG